MAWRDTLVALKEELAEVREERKRASQEEEAKRLELHKELTGLAESLEIATLLEEMNSILLDGKGSVTMYYSWDSEGGQGDDDALTNQMTNLSGGDSGDSTEEEEVDAVTAILAWEEDGEREVAIDVGAGEDEVYVQVNGIEVRPDRNALEQALVKAFRDELDL